MRDGKKRGTYPLKRFSNYLDATSAFPTMRPSRKEKSNFWSFTRISRSHLATPTYPKFQTSDRRDDSWKDVVRVPRKNI